MKLIQLNIERNKHLDRFLPFVESEKPDVVCLQEVMKSNLGEISRRLGMQYLYAPMAHLSGYPRVDKDDVFGVALFSRTLPVLRGMHYYVGTDTHIPTHEATRPDTRNTHINKVLLVADVVVVDQVFTIGTTHFTWSPKGVCTNEQRISWQALREKVSRYPSLVLSGDFNVPRATSELYDELTKEFSDNVPLDISYSLDPDLHRAPVEERQHMVDYILSRGTYVVDGVHRVCGVSDHCALIGNVQCVG